MTQVPPPPSGMPHEKKGLSTGAKVGIGCAVALLIALAAIGFGVYKTYQFAKKEFGDFLANPQSAVVEKMIEANPKLEQVDADFEAGIFTVKNKEDGKTYTIRTDQIQEGRLVMTDSEGNELVLGGADPSKIPAWVPQPHGLEKLRVTYLQNSPTESNGQYMAKLSATPEKTIERFEAEFGDGGSSASSHSNVSLGDKGRWQLTLEEEKRELNLLIVQAANENSIIVTWTESK